MKVWVLAVGRPGRLLAGPIAEFERRAARYWRLEVIEVKGSPATKGRTAAAVRDAEADRILERVPPAAELVALTRTGEAWSSTELAEFLEAAATRGRGDVTFAIGGPFGLGAAVLARADRKQALSTFTLAHDVARLVLGEQLYRAGTIVRGEPYHKART